MSERFGMSSSGPWSVKGIDPRARARAKTAARREGLTLGEWINRVILDGSDPSNPQWDDALEAYPGFGGGSALSEEDDRLLRAMVNRLTERVESSEKLSARTLSGIDKAITTELGAAPTFYFAEDCARAYGASNQSMGLLKSSCT